MLERVEGENLGETRPVFAAWRGERRCRRQGVEGEAASMSIRHSPLHQGGLPEEVALAGGMVVEGRGTGVARWLSALP